MRGSAEGPRRRRRGRETVVGWGDDADDAEGEGWAEVLRRYKSRPSDGLGGVEQSGGKPTPVTRALATGRTVAAATRSGGTEKEQVCREEQGARFRPR